MSNPGLETPWGRYAFVIFFAAIVLADLGADVHLPWWVMVGTAVTVAAFAGNQVRAMLRDDLMGLGLALAAATAGWLALYGMAWVGENFQEALWRPWRWWGECLMGALWAAAASRERAAP